MTPSSVLAQLRSALGDRFEIADEIGRGAAAIVFRARDLKHDRPVALKVLRPQLTAAIGAQRFLREIMLSARLQHPHILALYDSGQAGAFLYYVMPLVEGDTLRERMTAVGTFSLSEAARIAREIGEALDHAHAHGVIHRDIKPENILFHGPHAVVTDFGVARAINAAVGPRLTATGEAVGTPMYMSPEQAQGDKDIDGRSDIYGMGCIVYEMLTGRPPFLGPNAHAVARQHLLADPPPLWKVSPRVSPPASDVVAKAMAKDPADRFERAADFVAALEESAQDSGWWDRLRRALRRS